MEVAAQQVTIEQLENGSRLNLSSDLLYHAGSVELSPGGAAALDKVARTLATQSDEVDFAQAAFFHQTVLERRSSMKFPSGTKLAAGSLVLAAFSASAWAETPEDCQRAVDEVSVAGGAAYDSATEAEMTKYLNAAGTSLMQKTDKAQALNELATYQQKLDEAIKAQKIPAEDGAALKEKLDKAVRCVSSLE